MRLRFTNEKRSSTRSKAAGNRTWGSVHVMLVTIWYVAMTILSFVMAPRLAAASPCPSRHAPRWIAASHSSASITPSPDGSKTWSATSMRPGSSRSRRLSSPHVRRNSTTSSLPATASAISILVSVPLPSASIMSKHRRAALRNAVSASSSASFAADSSTSTTTDFLA